MSVIEWVFLAVIALELIIWIPFKMTCFFKKTCKRKKCPFRDTSAFRNELSFFSGKCKKCPYPYDEEEKRILNETADRLDLLIEQLKEQNK